MGLIGYKHTDEAKKKISEASKGNSYCKGKIPWNKGKKGVQDTSHLIGENNYQWKGENVSYRELHKWIERKLGKPKMCVFCRSTEEKKYDWANISGEYHRDLEDWIRLCRSCHIRYDRSI